jgi:hypothetical protein
MKRRLLSVGCIAFSLVFLAGCGSHLSGVYEANYGELIFQQANSLGQMWNSALDPLLQGLPQDMRRRLEQQQQQQQQTFEEFSSQMARSFPSTRLGFSWRKVTWSFYSLETTCSYKAGKDYVLISQKNDPWSLRLERRADGTLAWNELVFRQIPGSASSGSLALFLWIGGVLLLASSAGGSLWCLQRRGILGEVALFFDERFVLSKEPKLEMQSCKVVPMPPSVFEDDSRFMASGAGKPRDDSRFMPPEMRQAPASSSPSAPSPPRP